MVSANVNIKQLIDFHKEAKHLTTLTATLPTGRFGAIYLGEDQSKVTSFNEKPAGGAWINGGYFVLEPEVIDLQMTLLFGRKNHYRS